MSKKDYTPIGGIMSRKNGKKYEVSEPVMLTTCNGCAFIARSEKFCSGVPCIPAYRKDGKNVIFIRRKDLEETKQAPADSQ